MNSFSFVVFLLFVISIRAQQYPSFQYTDRNVLPNNTVRTLFKDIDGALWIGTDNGLVRKYNDQINTFYKEDGLSQNNIWAIAQDQSKQLWIGSYGKGLSTFKDNQFQIFPKNNLLPHQEITKLFEHNNFLYVGTSNGIAVIHLKNQEEVLTYNPKNNLKELFKVSDFIEVDGYVYGVTYSSGIYKIIVESDHVKALKVSDAKYLYAAHHHSKNVYLSGKEQFKVIPSQKLKDFTILENTAQLGYSVIWDYQQTEKRLYAAAWGIYKNDGGIYELTDSGMQSRNKEFGVTSKEVTSLAFDRDLQMLYIGTLDAGLYEVRLDRNIQFYNSSHLSTVDFAHIGEVQAFLFNDGLQVGNEFIPSQLFKKWQVDYVKRNINALPKHVDYFYELDYTTTAQNIVFYNIKKVQDTFWVNTSIGIYRFNDKGTLLEYLPVHALHFNFTPDGKLLEPNFFHGTRIYDTINPISYTYYNEKKSDQHPRFIVGSLQTKNKTYFTSIFSGLYVYENGVFTSFLKNNLWQENRLRFITTYKDDQMAISNEDGDLFIVTDTANDFEVKKINRNKSYGSTITFLSSYKDYVIIGTPKGVVLNNQGREIFINQEQGLMHKITNGKVKGNQLLLGSNNGYYQIKLDQFLKQQVPVDSIAISSLKINDLETNWRENKVLQLATDQNSINLQLTTNKRLYPGKLEYHYRLNPKSRWLPIQTKNLSLTFLEHGSYQLYIQVNDAATGRIFEQQVLAFHIAMPFYKTIWFVALCFIVAIGLLLQYFRLKRKRAQQKALEKEAITKRIEELKLEALLSQMNPHFMFNSLNSIQYFISNQENDKAMRYLSVFSELMRSNLNNTSQPFLTLTEEIDYLKKYTTLENARFADRIKITFNIDPQLSTTQTSIPTMILQPFVENVFVHAFPARIESPLIDIAFAKAGQTQYRCKITDNGIGSASLSKNKRHTSKGIQIVKERLSFLGYDPQTALHIDISSSGTAITLLLDL